MFRTLRGMLYLLVTVTVCFATTTAYAELLQVSVGGELRIRGRYYVNAFNTGMVQRATLPPAALYHRPVGPSLGNSLFDWDDRGSDQTFVETAVLLNFDTAFTDRVRGYFEFYSFDIWGQELRSNYLTGQDMRLATLDDIEVNQAYIEVSELWGSKLRLRVGRQALKFGKGWLVNEMTTPTQRLSFDGVRLTYDAAPWSIDAFSTKLTESMGAEIDGDVDFHGVYATYTATPSLSLSGYWFLIRDARSLPKQTLAAQLNLIDYDPSYLHTAGLRLFGKHGGWDYDLELAYQFGAADAYGARYTPVNGVLGDDTARYDAFGGEATLGYTFQEATWSPRLYVQGVYFSGEDHRDITIGEFLNPFFKPDASISFNRLFSDANYLPAGNDNGWMSNFYQVSAGVEAQVSPAVRLHFHVAREWIVAPFDAPRTNQPNLSFWTKQNSDDLGWETALWCKYNYSEDLSFMLYWNHLFPGRGLTDGAYTVWNGTMFSGGTDHDDDIDYFFWMAVLKF